MSTGSEVKCEDTRHFLCNEKTTAENIIFYSGHLQNAKKPIKFFASNPEVSDDITQTQCKKVSRIELDCPDIPTGYVSRAHIKKWAISGFHYHKLLKYLYNVTRDSYLVVEKNLRSRLLKGHKNCIERFQFMLKERGADFPPICPFAYAYVFWRKSLLQYEKFYSPPRGGRPPIRFLLHKIWILRSKM